MRHCVFGVSTNHFQLWMQIFQTLVRTAHNAAFPRHRQHFGVVHPITKRNTILAFCGPIGFIGLAMPHVTRMLFRNSDHRVLVPGTVLSGAAVLLLCDLVSKMFTLPINAITALLGIPIAVWVVLRNKSVTA